MKKDNKGPSGHAEMSMVLERKEMATKRKKSEKEREGKNGQERKEERGKKKNGRNPCQRQQCVTRACVDKLKLMAEFTGRREKENGLQERTIIIIIIIQETCSE